MGLVDQLKSAGFKPEANTDGEFKPLKGTYKASVVALRPEKDTKNKDAKFYLLELKPQEALEGDAFGDKMTFRKRYYMDGDKAADNLKDMLNALFTAGIELDTASDEALEASFEKAINKTVYLRAWGWKPDGKDSTYQMFSIIKEKVAEKKKSTAALPF